MIDPPIMLPIVTGIRLPIRKLLQFKFGKSAGLGAERYLMQIKLGRKQKSKLKLDFFFGDRRPQRNAALRKLCPIVREDGVARHSVSR